MRLGEKQGVCPEKINVIFRNKNPATQLAVAVVFDMTRTRNGTVRFY